MARTRPRYGRACATVRPTWPATRPASAQGRARRARGPGCWETRSRYKGAYRDRRAAWPLGCVAIQTRHGRGKSCYSRDTVTIRPRGGLRHDRLCLRHSTLRATTRRSAHAAGAHCAQPGPTMPVAMVPSFGLSALFQSLFGLLFMNTVHEHCSQVFQKNKK